MQAKDNMEEFFQKNRGAFDQKNPPESIWNSIEQELEPKSSNNLWYWKAAVFLLVGAVTYLLVDRSSQGIPTTTLDEQQAFVETSNLEKFEELETFYASIISNKTSKMSDEVEGQVQFGYLETEIKNLDVIYDDLKDVFLESQQSEQVLDRLMHILRQKIHLINSQIDILEQDRLPDNMKKELGITM
ncbi:hypothetical protein [Roseivirga sp.]|uniref:hypothetical protein n=1 Tax=Roseivirga sp. TaxID=1964215 RepID=UPI003B8C37F9